MDPLQPLIDTLDADGRPRVWSLVVTVFGDAVQVRGGQIATGRLSRLLGRIGIETGALRTALSRLSSEGWVKGRREGRTSRYTLTPEGQRQFAPATARIYAPPRTEPVPAWVFGEGARPGALSVAGGWLAPAPVDAPGFAITGQLSTGAAEAVWQALDPDHRVAVDRLASDLAALQALPDTPLDAAVARMLLVHRWRRLVLRWPELPADLVPEGFAPRDLHRTVAERYAALAPLSERWFDEPCDDLDPLPASSIAFARRFGSAQMP
ncbi:PaaX family transcriptional regulator C-terminal domain-containing protein [Thetidibacter halocola]|uniref:PaaX family transcriptional regulator n=1 Tax=Thetidibacter halocola TaxID=2827239 RepID=A0A8J7WHP5_9RHOB|nr:PaaX family transcriptional regulator C-terminal domain-containing protein [Thetidibacter halocola]MBS0125841.1 hypothetical protein [Thetidibacter halocola]